MFLVALQNLKYMGYVSPTKQSIFLFKKNFYGKPSLTVNSGLENDKNQENVNSKNVANAVGLGSLSSNIKK